ncbi:MAG: hypothetical protein AB1942_14200 [Pseudomonadota bacterium]
MSSDLPPLSPSTAVPASTEPAPQQQTASIGGPPDPPAEPRTFAPETSPDTVTDSAPAPRPQADFGAPIDVFAGDRGPIDRPSADPTGETPPLAAAADVTATPQLAEPRPAPVLTRRISQGMPSYSEPNPQIAGVVGRGARGGGKPVG